MSHHTTRLARPLKDETGKRYGRLTVIEQAPAPEHYKEKRQGFWLCRCDCGNTVVASGAALRRGCTTSCGCLTREIWTQQRTKHGMHKLSEYNIWHRIKRRCYDPRDDGYYAYGARGITMCDEWRESFEAFYAHIGPRPTPAHTVDRIDNARGYEPGNVRWATRKEQGNNRRTNIRLTYQGKTQTLKEWSREIGIPYHIVRSRYHSGKPVADILRPIKAAGVQHER